MVFIRLDELENLLDRLAENACNANCSLKARSNVPALQARHIGARHLEPKRQLGLFNPLDGPALSQLVCQLATHVPNANMTSFTCCEQHKINKV